VDAQGGRFHLLAGVDDWRSCGEPDSSWPGRTVLARDPDRAPSHFEWEARTGSLRLAHRDAITHRPRLTAVRTPDERRGADRDRYGTWYWITPDARAIVRLPPGATAAVPWWTIDDLDRTCAPTAGSFSTVPTPPTTDTSRLAGLAITADHHLAVGLIDDRGGLLLFDLHGGGTPTELRWPGAQAVTPFDLASTRAGGILVLDRSRRTWWRLDRTWRLVAGVTEGALAPFQDVPSPAPEDPDALHRQPPAVAPRGNQLPGIGPGAIVDPIAITEGPTTSVLVLDRPPAGPSALAIVSGDGAPARLPLTVEAIDPERPDLPSFVHDVVGQDIAWSGPDDEHPLAGPLVYVADASTSEAVAYQLTTVPPGVLHQPDVLPMRRWEAKGLVAVGGDVYYDSNGRWLPLEPYGICSFERGGTMHTPTGFGQGSVPGQPFDSGRPGCVWHRLFLDADIPDGCAIVVGARAADDPELLERLPFLPQPRPYLRNRGSELPWHDPWAAVRRPPSPRTGTWELLFQGIGGRYVQLELELSGTGRTTPSLRALRTWFPRFSYVTSYLPAVYEEEDEPDRLLERLLANMEGFFTEHEARIDHTSVLLDARTTPVEAIDWLASWMGLGLEPAWDEGRRRFLLRNLDRFYRLRGTVAGLRAILRLYLGCSADETVFDPGARMDDPARIVERFPARRFSLAALGDPTTGNDGTTITPNVAVDDPDAVQALAHRFRVLIAEDLDTDRAAMVDRIVAVARPAHTAYEVRTYEDLLIVGEARVGVDTLVGPSPRFAPIVLDATALAAGFLGAAHPFDIADRVVLDRDRLGDLPAL
jgi:phage tail-like protein